MVIEIHRKNMLMLLIIVLLYCALLVTVFFWAKDMGYNDGIAYQRDEIEEMKIKLESIINPPVLVPDHNISF